MPTSTAASNGIVVVVNDDDCIWDRIHPNNDQDTTSSQPGAAGNLATR